MATEISGIFNPETHSLGLLKYLPLSNSEDQAAYRQKLLDHPEALTVEQRLDRFIES